MFISTTITALGLAGAWLAPGGARADAVAGFERLKTMAGEWQGQASDGRKIRHSVRLIAAGSVLMEESWFEGHAGEMMVTMYHVDGERLLLTHYCVARNQPRMSATEISSDANRILFTFVDGTNLPSRNSGHMDKALFEFAGRDSFKSRWTWYKDGKEQWMEQFTFRRVKTAAGERRAHSSPNPLLKNDPLGEAARRSPPCHPGG